MAGPEEIEIISLFSYFKKKNPAKIKCWFRPISDLTQPDLEEFGNPVFFIFQGSDTLEPLARDAPPASPRRKESQKLDYSNIPWSLKEQLLGTSSSSFPHFCIPGAAEQEWSRHGQDHGSKTWKRLRMGDVELENFLWLPAPVKRFFLSWPFPTTQIFFFFSRTEPWKEQLQTEIFNPRALSLPFSSFPGSFAL